MLNRLLEQRTDFLLIFRKLKFENPTSVTSFDLQIAEPESRVLLYHNVDPGTDQENLYVAELCIASLRSLDTPGSQSR